MEPPILFSRKRTIQLAALALGIGAVIGAFWPPMFGLGALVGLGLSSWRWKPLWLISACFGLGLLRGWLAAPDVNSNGPARPNVVVEALGQVRDWTTRQINRSLPQPEAPFLAGLLLGSREEIPPEVRNDFRITGTSHIVAVSGYNVTIVITMIAAALRTLPLPRVTRSILVFAGIIGFVILTGGSPSVVRAGIMGALVVLAREVGRLSDGVHGLIVASSAMVLVSPATLASIGFQLSVAATAGLMLFSERFEERLAFVPKVFGLRGSLASTLSAILVTQPLISLYFGQVSLVAPMTNLLVLPLIPLAMATGFSVAMTVGIVPVLGPLVGWIAWAPLTAIIGIVRLSASLPLAAVKIPTLGSLLVAGGFAALAAFFAFAERKRYEPA
ncbi:MAG: ComEC/Rec2 family competence protein [Candidatus Kerfeldbacteria bacterium]|nr:ComEC/Rec2 family competence protein [Candidatus Kerfeldbacteria bacterium]